jgi:hypothetical protein
VIPKSALSNGKVVSSEFGLVVTLGYFTPQAISFARNKSNLRLIDGDDLVELILEHDEKLDSKYKAMVPLKRVYVPEPTDRTTSRVVGEERDRDWDCKIKGRSSRRPKRARSLGKV